jgi:cyclin H
MAAFLTCRFSLLTQTFIQSYYQKSEWPVHVKQIHTIYKQAETLLSFAFMQDLVFYYLPSELALAAFNQAAKATPEYSELFAKYLKETYGSFESYDKLISNMAQIQLNKTKTLEKEALQRIYDKVKRCPNPALDPKSLMYQKEKPADDDNPFE